MATLVLNTVGTILGGPIGGAIGSLVGQSIDQQLFGPGPRKGPRLGDLSVQTSSYGSAIPKIFGSMRVAGTIVWSTDLQEQSNTQSAKGQPDTITYSYSASFAVALSCRRISGVGRIWADGKLIRTADGEFTVGTEFRVHDGSDDQAVDPLIASEEGADSTPAYRGLALAVFENLQLAGFGNRIPFLTFEVIADPAPVAIGAVLSDVSEGLVAGAMATTLSGYAAYGATMAAALEPLVRAWGVELYDDGLQLSPPTSAEIAPTQDEMGCTADGGRASKLERSEVPAAALPSALSVSYYDPDRDYQTGVARASLDTVHGVAEQLELPAVLGAPAAKALAQTRLARSWAQRDRLTIRLPPAHLGIRPGALIVPPGDSWAWAAHKVTVDALAVVAELQPTCGTVDAVAADPGRIAGSDAALPSPTILALLELPDDGSGASDSPVVVAGATCASKSFRAVPLQVELGGMSSSTSTASAPAIVGTSINTLPPGQSAVFDLAGSVDVELAKADDWLQSRDDDALLAGENLAVLGSELFQFGDVLPLGNSCFRLSRLLRGRRGTEWAMPLHSAGDQFVMIDRARLQRIQVAAAQTGALLRLVPGGIADSSAEAVEVAITGEAMRPPGPVHLKACYDAAVLNCSWVRRSSRGWTWLDNVEVPLGCATELYRVTLTGPAGEIQVETSIPQVELAAADIAALGSGDGQIAVVQVGDLAVSRAASVSITLK
jgi:hypothetical protein